MKVVGRETWGKFLRKSKPGDVVVNEGGACLILNPDGPWLYNKKTGAFNKPHNEDNVYLARLKNGYTFCVSGSAWVTPMEAEVHIK